jgi:hypothetical protein
MHLATAKGLVRALKEVNHVENKDEVFEVTLNEA